MWLLCGLGNSWENEGRDKHDVEPEASFTEAHAAYKTIKLLFYTYSIIEHDEQNVLNLESVLFHLKCKTSSKQFWVTDFFEEKVICIQVLMQLLLIIV